MWIKEFLVLLVCGGALGLAVAWLEKRFNLDHGVVQVCWLALGGAALIYGLFAAWSYYKSYLDEDD